MHALRYLGKVAKTHGIEGNLLLIVEAELIDKIQKSKPVFLEIDGLPVPFFIKDLRILTNTSLLLSFIDYNSVELVKRFCGVKIFIDIDEGEHLDTESNLISYTFIDEKLGVLGVLQEIIIKQQNLFVLELDGKELLIPVVDEFITGLNHDKKELYLNLPEGMLDLS